MLLQCSGLFLPSALALLVCWTAWYAHAPPRRPWGWDTLIILGIGAVPAILLARRFLETWGDTRGLQVIVFVTIGVLSTLFIQKTVGIVVAVIFVVAYVAIVGRIARRLLLPEGHHREDNDTPDDRSE